MRSNDNVRKRKATRLPKADEPRPEEAKSLTNGLLAQVVNNLCAVSEDLTDVKSAIYDLKTAIEARLPEKDSIGTRASGEFWDCDCDESYIHPKKWVGGKGHCEKCGACEYSSPDSRISEIVKGLDGML